MKKSNVEQIRERKAAQVRSISKPKRKTNGQRLREERARRGWTQREAAQRFQVSTVTVKKWEQETRPIQGPALLVLSNLDRLFGPPSGA
jgi:DNA-binding transcriptional regulator YiaG